MNNIQNIGARPELIFILKDRNTLSSDRKTTHYFAKTLRTYPKKANTTVKSLPCKPTSPSSKSSSYSSYEERFTLKQSGIEIDINELNLSGSSSTISIRSVSGLSKKDFYHTFSQYTWRTYSEYTDGTSHFAKWLNKSGENIPSKKAKLNCWEGGLIALIQIQILTKQEICEAFSRGHSTKSEDGRSKTYEQEPEIVMGILGLSKSLPISESSPLQVGDILFFNGTMDHVAISLGGDSCMSLWVYPKEGLDRTSITEILDSYNKAPHKPGDPDSLNWEDIRVSTKFRERTK